MKPVESEITPNPVIKSHLPEEKEAKKADAIAESRYAVQPPVLSSEEAEPAEASRYAVQPSAEALSPVAASSYTLQPSPEELDKKLESAVTRPTSASALNAEADALSSSPAKAEAKSAESKSPEEKSLPPLPRLKSEINLSLLETDLFLGVRKIPVRQLKRSHELGSGQYGTVYRGEWGQHAVAIKEMNVKSRQSQKTLRWEIARLAGVNHPRIAGFYGGYLDRSRPVGEVIACSVLEFCSGVI